MSFVLNGVTLPNPQQFNESHILVGGISRTMLGSARRAIRGRKRVWNLSWDVLTQSEFDSIFSIYQENEAVSFANSALQTPISTEVLVDIERHEYLPGTGENYISSVELVLTET